jgi:L-fuculose-phosphate aldolase
VSDAEHVSADSIVTRLAMIDACRQMSAEGLFVGTWGNISVRTGRGLLVTPSRLPIEEMEPEDMVLVSFTGEKLDGRRLPSSETELHRVVLAGAPHLGALIHIHSRAVMALAALRRDLPVCSEEMAQILGGPARCAAYVPAGHHQALAQAVSAVMNGGDVCAALLANHGGLAGGRDLAEAMVASRVLEKAAWLYLAAAAVGDVHPIPPELVEEERRRYLYKYGVEDVTAKPNTACTDGSQ